MRYYNTISTNATLSTSHIKEQTTTSSNSDRIRVLFEYLFSTEDSLKSRNKFLFLFLAQHIETGKTDVINQFINDDAIIDLHISLLKSTLLMVENLEGVSNNKIKQIYSSKI